MSMLMAVVAVAALLFGERALATGSLHYFRARLGDEHPKTLVAMAYYGDVLARYGGSLEIAHESLERSRLSLAALLGADHPDTLTATHFEALLLHKLGNEDKAAEMLRVALLGRMDALGDDHPLTLAVLDDLGPARAQAAVRASLDAKKLQLDHEGPLHPATSASILARRFGKLLKRRAATQYAGQELLVETASERLALLGEDHPLTLEAMTDAKEDAVFVRHTALVAKVGSEAPEALRSLKRWATLCEEKGRVAEASMSFHELHSISRKVLGERHSDTVEAMNSVGRLKMRRTLEIRERWDTFSKERRELHMKGSEMLGVTYGFGIIH